ncbi:MAG: restriction endonuclease, partial [Rhodovarius sp.]|nr:restriction endonuclease [Rhodovarius sp.]
MAIPDFQTLMLPVLQALAQGERHLAELTEDLAAQFRLTPEERATLLPSGRMGTFRNRVGWAVAYLLRARLIERVARGVYRLTERGRSVLAAPPERITIAFLRQFPEFVTLRPEAEGKPGETRPASGAESAEITSTPEERIEEALAQIEAELRARLLQRLREVEPAFFEQVVLDLLVAMGYGSETEARELRGRSGDGGIDGVIREDRLG